MRLFEDGGHVVIMGAAGCGKSFLIREFRNRAATTGMILVVTATTGIAAHNIQGMTLHSFLGLGVGCMDPETVLKRVRKKAYAVQNLRSTDVLVIDEISMMSAELFECIDFVAREIRGKPDEPFGGMRLILTGDFMQLLPVFTDARGDQRLLFESPLFLEISRGRSVVLDTNFRQQNDEAYSAMLGRLRYGEHTTEDLRTLAARAHALPPRDVLHLVASNAEAQRINKRNLDDLEKRAHPNRPAKRIYQCVFMTSGKNKELCTILEKDARKQATDRGILSLELCIGARVMLLKNMCVESGLVNGSLGVVVGFSPEGPRVAFDHGPSVVVPITQWTTEIRDHKCVTTQVPLMLSWAVTIHKSQSLTLSCVVVHVGGCFCEHQVYVALSRVRSIDGLYIYGWSPSRILVDETTLLFVRGEKRI